jgi:hypothetical protein
MASWCETYDSDPQYEENRDLCCECKESNEKLEDIREHMTDLLKELYGNNPLDVCNFEWHVEEICALIDVRLPQNELRISKF